MIKYETETEVYILKFFHKKDKKTGRLRSTTAQLIYDGPHTGEGVVELLATVRPYFKDTISKKSGRQFALKKLFTENATVIPRHVRKALGHGAGFRG